MKSWIVILFIIGAVGAVTLSGGSAVAEPQCACVDGWKTRTETTDPGSGEVCTVYWVCKTSDTCNAVYDNHVKVTAVVNGKTLETEIVVDYTGRWFQTTKQCSDNVDGIERGTPGSLR